jgi:hypothetical protein
MGGSGGIASGPSSRDAGFRSMMHFWMGGVESGAGTPPPPGGGAIEPVYFVANLGRMMNRMGGA